MRTAREDVLPRTPRAAAALLELAPRLPAGDRERFSGYGVLGVTFASGHVLALRRITAASVGPAFTTVWHRDPAGLWRFYADAAAEGTCLRYFGVAGEAMAEERISIAWHGPTTFTVRVPGPRIAWAVHLGPSNGARALAAVRRRLPASFRRRPSVRRLLDRVAGRVLELEHLTMEGRTPSGHHFQLDAHEYWVVDWSTARCRDEHLGPPVCPRAPVRLADFTVPAWGVFTTGDAYFERERRDERDGADWTGRAG
jgi:hypothetical protein